MKKTNVAYVMGLAGLLVTASVWADEPAAAPQSDAAVAQVLYDQGKDAIKAGNLGKAQLLFRESLKKAEWPKTGAQLGRVLIEQGELVEGANYLEWFFKEDKEVPKGLKDEVRLTLNAATPHIVAITLVVDPADAVVHIDDKLIVPNRFGWTHYVAAGKEHTFRAEKKGFETTIQKKSFGAGVSDTVTLTLVPAKEEAKGPVKVEGPKVVKVHEPTTELKIARIAAGTLLGASVGAGIGAAIAWSAADNAFVGDGCTGTVACRKAYERVVPVMKGLAYTSAVAGTLGAVAVGYVVYGTLVHRKEHASLQVVPALNGAWVVGTF